MKHYHHTAHFYVIPFLSVALVWLTGCTGMCSRGRLVDGHSDQSKMIASISSNMTAAVLQVCSAHVFDQYRWRIAWHHRANFMEMWQITLESRNGKYGVQVMKESFRFADAIEPQVFEVPVDQFALDVAEEEGKDRRMKLVENGKKSINGITFNHAVLTSSNGYKVEGFARSFKARGGSVSFHIVFCGPSDSYRDENIQEFMGYVSDVGME